MIAATLSAKFMSDTRAFSGRGRIFSSPARIDVKMDSHHQTEREFRFDWQDRSRKRPLLSLRRLSAQYHRAGLTLEAGKQFVRWGRTDIVNPTDRFAPRDFLTVVDNEFLGIEAVRGTYEQGSNTDGRHLVAATHPEQDSSVLTTLVHSSSRCATLHG